MKGFTFGNGYTGAIQRKLVFAGKPSGAASVFLEQVDVLSRIDAAD